MKEALNYWVATNDVVSVEMKSIWNQSLFHINDLPFKALPETYDEFYEYYQKDRMKIRQ